MRLRAAGQGENVEEALKMVKFLFSGFFIPENRKNDVLKSVKGEEGEEGI